MRSRRSPKPSRIIPSSPAVKRCRSCTDCLSNRQQVNPPWCNRREALDSPAKPEIRIVIVNSRGVCFTGCTMKRFTRFAALLAVFLVCFPLGCSSSPSAGGGSQGPKATMSISSISPTSLPAGMAAAVTVTGTGFTANTVISVNGTSLPTTYVSATQVTAAIATGQFPSGVILNITVGAT